MHIKRSVNNSIRENVTYQERIDGFDRGLINAWEVGRELALRNPDLVEKMRNGELPVLNVKGGVDRPIKDTKIGSLWYIAMRQGLLGDDLDIDIDSEVELVCSMTSVRVLYTLDIDKLANAK